MKPYLIASSLLSADFARLGEDATSVLKAGADLIHCDVMDNHYVPNLTFGPLVCRALRKYGIRAPLDVHLMVKPVDRLIKEFASAGAACITFHPEASRHVDRSLKLIRDCDCFAGLALNPATPLAVLDHVWPKLDVILLMTVNPGFGGQTFIPHMMEKIKKTRQLIDRCGYPVKLAVDGGINSHNIAEVAASGAEIFVMGSALFGTKNYKKAIQTLKKALR